VGHLKFSEADCKNRR